MRYSLLLFSLCGSAGCRTGLLENGEWGTLRYFGELAGVAPSRFDSDNAQPVMELIPPISDRNGNTYVLYEEPTGGSVVYVGEALGGWSKGCPAGEEMLPNVDVTEAQVRGFLGASDDMAWFWAGDALVQVSGETGACKQILDKDPLTVTDLRVMAALPYIHETPARRTVSAWVQGSNDAISRRPPFEVVVDLDLRRYVSYKEFEPSDARCVDILGVGGSDSREEGVVVVAYNLDGERIVEARIIDATGHTTFNVPLSLDDSDVYACDEFGEPTPEPKIVGQLQANDRGVYAAILTNGQLLAFNEKGGDARKLPDFDAQGLVRFDGELWVSGTLDDRPVIGQIQADGQVQKVVQWTTSENAARALQGKISVLDQRYQPAEPIAWRSPVTAVGSWPFISPFPLDEYALNTTGWLVAGPSFESTLSRTAVAFGPVGIAVP
jgi:hypothetical protein